MTPKKTIKQNNLLKDLDLIPSGINDSDFSRSLFLLRMQIALEEIRERLKALQEPDEIARTQEELATSQQFYETYLAPFN